MQFEPSVKHSSLIHRPVGVISGSAIIGFMNLALSGHIFPLFILGSVSRAECILSFLRKDLLDPLLPKVSIVDPYAFLPVNFLQLPG